MEKPFDKFNDFCSHHYCLRKVKWNEKCLSEEKQQKCLLKYTRNKIRKEKRIIDRNYDYNNFLVGVWRKFYPNWNGFSQHDDWEKYCMIWLILTVDERLGIIKNYEKDLWLQKNLDIAHIFPKDERPDLIHDIENGVIVGRYFHNLLDEFRHPITREQITKEDRLQWLQWAKKGERT